MKKYVCMALAVLLNVLVASGMQSTQNLRAHFSQVSNKNSDLEKKRSMLANVPELEPEKACEIDPSIVCEPIPSHKRLGVCYNYAMMKTLCRYGIDETFNIIGCQDWQKVLCFFKEVDRCKQGDLAVYFDVSSRNNKKEIHHYGLVADPDVLLIEGKWGTIKAIYKHPIFCLPEGYGENVAIMRLKKEYRMRGEGQDLFVDHIRMIMEEPQRVKSELERREKMVLSIANRHSDYDQENKNTLFTILEQVPSLSLNIRDNQGRTPLMLAAKQGSVGIVRMFLEYGADVCLRDIEDKSVLDIAEEEGNSDIVSLLL